MNETERTQNDGGVLPVGRVTGRLTEDRSWDRRRFLRSGLGAAAGVAALPALSTRAKAAGAPFDFSFYQVGDTHYLAFDTSIKDGVLLNNVVRANLGRMMALTPSTAMPGAGTVGNPVGVIHVGDLLESGSETDPSTGQAIGKTATLEKQWTNYTKDFGLMGNEADSIVKFPVYEGYGNHDQDGFLKQVSDRIAARAAAHTLTGQSGSFTYVGAYGNITVSGVHYAWKWGPVHFVQANIRSGDGFQRMPCSGSYSFLRNYLENTVGSSGDPVMVIVHYPPDSGGETEWPKADKQAFYDLLIRFNVIGILCGHTHSFGSYLWKGPDGIGSVELPVYRCDCLFHTAGGFMNVFRIKNDPNDATKGILVMVQRNVNDTWGTATTRSFALSSNPNPDPDPGQTGLSVVQWQSVNSHNGTLLGLVIAGNTFVEPRQAGLRQIEVLFGENIVVPNPAAAVTITGVNASGVISSLASLGITANVSVVNGNTLVITFANGGGPVALPDAAKWRFTLNPAAITGASGATLTASVTTTRVVAGLVGDFDGNGRVTGIDLNGISTTTGFDPAIDDCLRADIDGDGVIGLTDVNLAWANRAKRTDNLATPS